MATVPCAYCHGWILLLLVPAPPPQAPWDACMRRCAESTAIRAIQTSSPTMDVTTVAGMSTAVLDEP
eukprot:375257-Pelagomonas_calceolata.AAC.1